MIAFASETKTCKTKHKSCGIGRNNSPYGLYGCFVLSLGRRGPNYRKAALAVGNVCGCQLSSSLQSAIPARVPVEAMHCGESLCMSDCGPCAEQTQGCPHQQQNSSGLPPVNTVHFPSSLICAAGSQRLRRLAWAMMRRLEAATNSERLSIS